MWEKLKALVDNAKVDIDATVTLLSNMTASQYQLYVAAGTMNLPMSEQLEMKAKFSELAKSIASTTPGSDKRDWRETAWMLDPKTSGGKVTRIY